MGSSISSFLFWMLFLSFSAAKSDYKFPTLVNGNHQDVTEDSADRRTFSRREKREIPTPFFWDDLSTCLSQTSCSGIKGIKSVAYGANDVFYVATQSEIFKVEYAGNDNGSCNCPVIHTGTDPVLTIVMDDQYLYWLVEIRKKVVYMALSGGDENTLLSRELSPEMFAEDKKVHRAACTISTYISDPPLPYFISGTHVLFNLTKVKKLQQDWFKSSVCMHEAKPKISYAFIYGKATLSSTEQCVENKHCIFQNVSSNEILNRVQLGDLHAGTDYVVNIVVFSEANGFVSATISPSVKFRTTCEVSSPPRNLTCYGVNDTALKLLWNEPERKNSAEIFYRIYQNSDETTTLKEFRSTGGSEYFDHSKISYAEHNYTIRVYPVSCPAFANDYSEDMITGCKPLLGPVKLDVERATDMEIQVFWKAPSDGGIQNVIIEWRNMEDATPIWFRSKIIPVQGSFPYIITDLVPNTGYSFRARQQYIRYSGDEGWLYSTESAGKTSPGVPGYPKNVKVVEREEKNYLTWSLPDDNGEQLQSYIISYRNRTSPNASRRLVGSWEFLSRITARSVCGCEWEIVKLPEDIWYEFRVSAFNAIGEGDASAPSQPFKYIVPEVSEEVSMLWVIVGTTGGLVVLIVILIFVVACRKCGQEPRTVYRSPSSSEITTIHLSYGKDLQLAQLRHMSELASIRGVPSVPQDYMDLLPLFPREKLELTEFLGKGAFGEVFKGIAREGRLGTEQRVAVKTLREGSTDSEKCEFLMEAYFMSNFNHENIVTLIGVCLDNEPQYLIMELMDGGDLMHYLRDARPNPILGPKLTTTDLLDICLDVAAGCKYLEDQRFIHRDLAARNCLVSTKAYATENRVVKIGDFGLARDIYRNDYYHKVGEGLLPVRWMAPESLVDNIYTTQSDVWAFGVLMWEVTSFAQQPYPTYTNIEVLHHIRAGGRLLCPDNCPKDMYALMAKCWNATPTLRPSFSWALQWLQEFKHRNLGLASSGSEYDLPAVNYTTVTTSDEDYVDDGIPTPTRSNSPLPEEDENYHESQENQDEILTFAQIHHNPSFLDDENDGTMCPIHSENGSSLPGNANGYLHVSENSLSHMLANARSQLHGQEPTDESEDYDNELNYSILNFPPSRSQSQKSNAVSRCRDGEQCTHNQQTSAEEATQQTLLPYMGDLPITDEERLYRKEQWSRQSRNQNVVTEVQGEETAENADESLSPYMRGASNYAFVVNSNSVTSPRHSHSDITLPKQLAWVERSEDEFDDISDESFSSYSVVSGIPHRNYQQNETPVSQGNLQHSEEILNHLNPRANVPTYV